jgi:hypothetical protein
MNARDVYRIKDIAQKIDSGDLEGVNYDEARQILERMGLPESGKGIKHLIQKYKNIYDPEFQKRFQRIHNRELDQINNKYQDKLNRVGDLSWKYGWGDMTNRNFYRLREIQKKLKDQKSIETSPFIRRDPSKSATKILNISIRENEKAIQRTNNVAPLGVNDLNPGTETRNAIEAIAEKRRKITPSTKLKRVAGETSSYLPLEDAIILRPGDGSAILGHETGHAISRKKGLERKTPGLLDKLAEENYATSQSNAIHNLAVKRGKISPVYAESGKRELDDCFQSYVTSGIHDLNRDLMENFPIYKKR